MRTYICRTLPARKGAAVLGNWEHLAKLDAVPEQELVSAGVLAAHCDRCNHIGV
jgi:hypothetical protein